MSVAQRRRSPGSAIGVATAATQAAGAAMAGRQVERRQAYTAT
jgi:hypothetical protein